MKEVLSEHLRVGDILELHDDDIVPADCIIM